MARTTAYGDPAHKDRQEGLAQRTQEQVVSQAQAAGRAVVDNPWTTMAVVAGLAFAVGALWKVSQARQPSGVDRLMDRLGDLQRELPRRWRA